MSEEKAANSELQVHSANSWETADLGDEERNKKFLRLMGAAKKEHHGKIIIGDKETETVHSRTKGDTEHINQELEEQFKHSLENRVTRKHHIGLGFSEASPTAKEPSSSEKSAAGSDNSSASSPKSSEKGDNSKVDNDEKSSGDSEKSTDKQSPSSPEKSERKRENDEQTGGDTHSTSKKPKMMMNFVKASD